tara:strand:+ start:1916 stop:2095 length:180 start_codon:yes stop_codon:yes gene_type:complete
MQNYDSSDKLPTFLDVYTYETRRAHIMMILECVENGSLDQENVNDDDYAEAYIALTQGM